MLTVSGVVTGVATMFDLGNRYAPYEAILGKDADILLKEVDSILRNTSVVLENHKDILTPVEYEQFKAQYRTYHWKMTDEGQQHRAVRDEIIRNSRILSQLYANKESRQDRAMELLATVETYQTNVLAASRSASLKGVPAFPDEETTSSKSWGDTDTQSSSASVTSWFSALGRSSRGSSVSDIESITGSTSCITSPSATVTQSVAKDIAQGEGFIVAVTHIPQSKSTPFEVGTDAIQHASQSVNVYRRMISFENADRRIDIIDPRFHNLKDDELQMDESSFLAMSEFGRKLMSERNTGTPGCQLTVETTKLSMETVVSDVKGASVDMRVE